MAKKATIPEVDYGPLKGLIGVWKGNKGMDISPEIVGDDKSPYHETIKFEGAGDLINAGRQKIAMIRYHTVVTRKSNNEVFHDQVGYWMWDAAANTIMHSLTVPRGLCVLAGGKNKNNPKKSKLITLEVKAKLNDKNWSIVQSPFMRNHASTLEFKQKILLNSNKIEYDETIVLKIYGRKFNHTDKNTLTRVK